MPPSASPSYPSQVYEFGPFSVDTVKRVLQKDRETVAITGKAVEVLLVLLARAGEVVEKDELLAQVWPDTVVEENNLVRHISMIRKALHDNLAEHRYIVTVAGRGYRFVAPVTSGVSGGAEVSEAVTTGALAIAPGPWEDSRLAPLKSRDEAVGAIGDHRTGATGAGRLRWWAIASIAAAGLAGTIVATMWMVRSRVSGERGPRAFSQYTFEPGTAASPAWSPDGTSMAFSSDRGGNADIWVQASDGGHPIQVTDAPEADDQPSWSPDGSTLAFRSERAGGGLYVVPAAGGAVRRIAAFGYRPSWSPDGRQVLFVSAMLEQVREAPKVFLVDPPGGTPREILGQLLPQFTWPHVAWHPDGKRVSVWGNHRDRGWSFWTVSLADESRAIVSEPSSPVRDALGAIGFRAFAWSPDERELYFTGTARGTSGIWRVDVEPDTLRWTGGPERLTTSPGVNRDLAVSRDGRRLAFIIQNEQTRLWAFPFDSNRGILTGPETALTSAGADASSPDVTLDGSRLVYRLVRGTRQELRSRRFEDGHEELLVSSESPLVDPHWSPDGTMVAYRRDGLQSAAGSEEQAVALLSVPRKEERLLTSPGSGATAQDWSPDGQFVLGRCADDVRELSRLCVYPVAAAPRAETAMRVLAADSRANVWQGRYSSDGRWIVFNTIRPSEAESSSIHVIRAGGGAWTRITSGQWFDDKARWSADGRTIYFVSNRGASLNVWGRRFDPIAGQPLGEPFAVTHLDSPERVLLPRTGSLSMVVSRRLLIVPVTSLSGNAWTLDNPGR